MLYPDEAANFYTDFYRYLVRLGVIGDGSCFIHALLLATRDDYDDMSEERRQELAAEFRENLAQEITQAKFQELAGGNLASRLYQENFMRIFEGLKHRFESEKHVYSTLLCAVGVDAISEALSTADTPEESVVHIVTAINNGLNTDRYSQKANELMTKISLKARNKSYESFIQKLRDVEEYVDNDILTVIAANFDRDVYIFDASTGNPYKGLTVSDPPKELSVFVIYDPDEEHYELMGEVDYRGDYSVQFKGTHNLVVKTREALGYVSASIPSTETPVPAVRSPRSSPEKIRLPRPPRKAPHKARRSDNNSLVSSASAATGVSRSSRLALGGSKSRTKSATTLREILAQHQNRRPGKFDDSWE